MNIFFIVIFDQKSFTKESIYIFLQFRKWFKNNISNHSRKSFIDPFLSNFSIYLFIYFHLFIFPPLSSRLLPFLFCFFHVMVSRIRAYSKLLPIGEVFTSNWSFVSVSKTVSPIRDNVSCTLTRMYRPRNELFRGNASLIIFPPVHRLFFFFFFFSRTQSCFQSITRTLLEIYCHSWL